MPGYSHSPDRGLEWLFAAMMVAWGVYLMMPFNTFAAPQYELLLAIADEKVWAVWSAGMGVMRMAALYINGSVRQTPIVRVVGAIFGMLWWSVLMWLFYSAKDGTLPAGAVWYPLFVLAEGYSVFRSAGDAWSTGALQRRVAS